MYWIIAGIFVGFALNTDYCKDSVERVRTCCRRTAELKKMQKVANIKLSYRLIMITCQVLWNTLWLMISQKLNNTVTQIGKNRYEIRFVIGGKTYATIVKHQMGPSNILQIIDTKDNDVTQQVEPYMLFNNESVTPGDLGYENITIIQQNGEDRECNKNDKIN